MESRKYQLQKQIIEALKANDEDLYSLLKSQWAHRFGVESLEELNNLDLKQLNQNSTNVDIQKIDQSQEELIEKDKPIPIKDFDNKEKEIKISLIDSTKDENNQSLKTKSYEIIDKGIYENKGTKPIKENKNQPLVQTLIPLPPKPKYSYLKKWLLRK